MNSGNFIIAVLFYVIVLKEWRDKYQKWYALFAIKNSEEMLS